MAQPARPLELPAAPPRLRVVAPSRAVPRSVVRRRRAVALAGLAGLVVLPVAFLVPGGGPADTGRIAALLSRGASEPRWLCDHLSAAALRVAGGPAACRAASPSRGPGGRVGGIRVEGGRARALVTGPGGTDVVRLVRERGEWKVEAPG